MPEANCAIRYSSKAIIFAKRSLIRPGGHWWAVKAYPIFSDSHFSQKSFIQGPRVSLNQEFQQYVAMFVYMYSGNFILSNTMRPNFLWSNFRIFHFLSIWGGILWVIIRSKLEFFFITGEIVRTSQKKIMMSSILPKNERNSLSWVKKILRIVSFIRFCFL